MACTPRTRRPADVPEDDVSVASVKAGCSAVLDKGRAWVELVSAVPAAYQGETTIS